MNNICDFCGKEVKEEFETLYLTTESDELEEVKACCDCLEVISLTCGLIDDELD